MGARHDDHGDGRVTKLTLGKNNLVGTLPAELGDLTSLTDLQLFGNPSLTGTIPASLGNLVSLQTGVPERTTS